MKHLLKYAKEFGLPQEQIGTLKAIQPDFTRAEARLEADAKVAKLELDAVPSVRTPRGTATLREQVS